MRARMIGAVVAAVVVSGSLLAALYAGDPDAGVWLHLAMALLWTFTLGVALAYRTAELFVMRAVCDRFGLLYSEPESVKLVDRRMLRTEQRDLMPPALLGEDRFDAEPYPERVVPWSPRLARETFLATFHDLMRERRG